MTEFRLEVAVPMMVTVLSPVEFQYCNLHFEPVTTKLLLQVQAWTTRIQHIQASVWNGKKQQGLSVPSLSLAVYARALQREHCS